MKEIIKTIWFLASFILLLIRRWLESRLKRSPKITVLLFHDVSKNDEQKLANLLSILKNFGHFITPSDFDEYSLGKRDFTKSLFLLTFDDGFVSSGEFAKTYLARLGIKATFFICPGFVGKKHNESNEFIINNLFLGEFDHAKITTYQSPMSDNEIKELLQNGHAIGSHSFSHKKLSCLSDHRLLYHEIVDSKIALENSFNVKINSFAYPFGDIGSISPDALKLIKENYDLNFTGIRGRFSQGGSSPLSIWRQSINIEDSLLYCIFCALGGLDLFYSSAQTTYKSYLR